MDGIIPDDEIKPVKQNGKKLTLNFTDKDDKENAKFNDARLVDILRNYPLLYNKSLESYGDPDYTQWMWGEIANEMNEPHRKTRINLPFNWVNCRDQWDVVQRALRYLSNPAAKSFRYPKQFRDCLEFFQNYIKDRREPAHTDRSQDLFLNQVNLLEQLPFEKQLLLEKEVLDVILSNELEFCAPMVDPQSAEDKAREEFGKVIGLLMPEVDAYIVQNEMSTESEPFVLPDFIQKTENAQVPISEPVTEEKQFLDMYSNSETSFKRSVSQFDLDSFLQIPSKRVQVIVPGMEGNIQYSVEEIIQEDIVEGDNIQAAIQDDVIEGDIVQEDADGMQGCVYQDDAMQEDFIEEVVTQNMRKDMADLNINGQFEMPVNRLDFVSVLNDILK